MYNILYLISGLLVMYAILQIIPKRTASMPLDYNVKEEEEIIASLKQNINNIPGLQLITSEAFAYPVHAEIWRCKERAMATVGQELIPAALVDWVENNYTPGESFSNLVKKLKMNQAVKVGTDSITIINNEYELRLIAATGDKVGFTYDSWLSKVTEFEREFTLELSQSGLMENYQNIINSSLVEKNDQTIYENKINEYASNLISSYEDRTSYNGVNKIISTNEKEKPLVREATRPNVSMQVVALVVTFLGSIAILNFESNWLGRVALLILLVASLEWAIVDLMTMYLDDKAFYLGVSLGWGLTILALWEQQRLSQLIPGVVFTLAMVVIFEGINKYFRYRRGMDGLGFGDTLIIVGTVGIPTALAGAWVLGYRIVMLSFILGIMGFFYMKIVNKHKKTQPFAFGPYLAIGWVFGIISWVLTNGISGLAF